MIEKRLYQLFVVFVREPKQMWGRLHISQKNSCRLLVRGDCRKKDVLVDSSLGVDCLLPSTVPIHVSQATPITTPTVVMLVVAVELDKDYFDRNRQTDGRVAELFHKLQEHGVFQDHCRNRSFGGNDVVKPFS